MTRQERDIQMNVRNIKSIRIMAAVCSAFLVLTGCANSRESLTESEVVTAAPTEVPKYEPANAADLAEKTAGKLEELQSVHMALSADVNARIDILGTIMSGLGNMGNGEDFVPDLDSILGSGSQTNADGSVQSTSVGTMPACRLEAGKTTVSENGTFRQMTRQCVRSDTAGNEGFTEMESSGKSDSAFSMNLRYDADIQGNPSGMHFYGNADVSILGDLTQVPIDAYYFEEDGEHALYTQKSGSWERQVVEMESVSPSDSSMFFEAIADGTVNAGLSDMIVEVNGHETYRMNVTLTGENIESVLPLVMGPLQNAVESNSTLHSLFGSAPDVTTLEGTGIPIRIYIDRETLYPVQMRLEMTEFGKKLLDSLSIVKVDVDAFDAVIDYSQINETSAGKAPM